MAAIEMNDVRICR